MTLTSGDTLGQYRIVEQAGRGGMAMVYKAFQASLSRYVALKVLPEFFAEEPGFRERFQREAVAVAALRHPNILTIFDYGEENGLHYIVTEFVDGGTLRDQLDQPLPPDYTARMLGPVASALDYAHARGTIHRDVKPANILLARDGTPILSDFGLASMMGSLPRLTVTGTAMGTPEYMAPEQAGGEAAGPASDLYALAVIAYEMITGRVPFTADTPLAVLMAHLHKPLPLPGAVHPAVPADVEAVLLKGLAKSAADRYPSASAFVAALAQPPPLAFEPAVVSPPRVAAPSIPMQPRSSAPVLVAGRGVFGLSPALSFAVGAGSALLLALAVTLVVVLSRGSGTGGPSPTEATPTAIVALVPPSAPVEAELAAAPSPTDEPAPTEEPTAEPTAIPQPTARPVVQPAPAPPRPAPTATKVPPRF